MLRKRVQHIGTDCLLKLIRAELLIGPRFNPGIRRLALAVLLKALDQVAKPATQQTSRTRTAEHPSQLAKHAALLIVRARCSAWLLLQPAKHFGNLVPVLITRNGEKSQKCSHGR